MKILFHVGVGNTDRPERWKFVNGLFSDLARTFESLGHSSIVWYHQKAFHPIVFKENISSIDIDFLSGEELNKFDWIFTWNGNNDGDKELLKKVKKEKMIFAELGFFDHYKTCYFDFGGVNSNSNNLTEKLDSTYDLNLYNSLVEKFKKPRLFKEDFVFVPLQDERDTQIAQFSNVKSMEELLSFVEERYKNKNIKILYKKHPQYKLQIKERKNFIEVKDDVHHYIPYATEVCGINSTVLFETLLYHKRIYALGRGLMTRSVSDDNERIAYIMHCYKRQFYWEELKDINKIKNSYFFKRMQETCEKTS